MYRPLGHVEDEPVARQVGDRDLHLGNKDAATDRGQAFDAVLSVSKAETAKEAVEPLRERDSDRLSDATATFEDEAE